MTVLLAALAILPSQPQDFETLCPIMANRPTTGRMAAEYGGFRIFVCCDQCLGRVGRNTKQVVASAVKRNALIGDFMFDPVTHLRADKKQAKATSAQAGFLYYNTQSEKSDFIGETEKNLARIPEKECLTCPVDGKEFKWSAKAGAFADQEGVRYFLCDQDCFTAFTKNPGQANKVTAKVIPVQARPYPIMGIDD